MPAQLATLLCYIFIIFLYWVDSKRKVEVSKAIWIPQIWIFIIGTRFVSQWLNLGAPPSSGANYAEGSPIDRNVFLLLICTSFYVLSRRGLNWNQVIKNNWYILLYVFYGLVSVTWSDFPVSSLKRWIKGLGTLSIVLMIMTEKRPYDAIGLLMRRLTYLMLPLSVLFIKYYPAYGRSFHMGEPLYSGVTAHKNSLGALCMIVGIYFFWSWIYEPRKVPLKERKWNYMVNCITMVMIFWLLHMADSATSLSCFIMAMLIFLIARIPFFFNNAKALLIFGITGLVIALTLEYTIELKATLITMLGRRPDLTTRVPMWEDLLSMAEDSLLGVGFESFWLGYRLEWVQARWGEVTNSHNGYLETYLNVGIFGLSMLITWILKGLSLIVKNLFTDYKTGVFRLGFISIILIYNWTEVSFVSLGFMWLIFVLITVDVSGEILLEPPAETRG